MAEERTVSSTGGEKGVKPERHSLIPKAPLDLLARVYGFGTLKYAPHNYRKGYEWSKSYDALQRHLNAWWERDEIDEESGLSHLGHAAWHVFTLIVFSSDRRYAQFDDRYSNPDSPELIVERNKKLDELYDDATKAEWNHNPTAGLRELTPSEISGTWTNALGPNVAAVYTNESNADVYPLGLKHDLCTVEFKNGRVECVNHDTPQSPEKNPSQKNLRNIIYPVTQTHSVLCKVGMINGDLVCKGHVPPVTEPHTHNNDAEAHHKVESRVDALESTAEALLRSLEAARAGEVDAAMNRVEEQEDDAVIKGCDFHKYWSGEGYHFVCSKHGKTKTLKEDVQPETCS